MVYESKLTRCLLWDETCIFSDTLASTGKLGEVNKHSGVLGIPAMLACAMARKVFTTASANEDEVDGPDAGGAVVAG